MQRPLDIDFIIRHTLPVHEEVGIECFFPLVRRNKSLAPFNPLLLKSAYCDIAVSLLRGREIRTRSHFKVTQ